MAINTRRARELLRQFDFRRLFAEELSWASPSPKASHYTIDDRTYTSTPIAEQGGMMVFEVQDTKDGLIPGRAAQLKTSRQIAKTYAEHILIFVNATRTASLWLWVKRQNGRLLPRDHRYSRSQAGDALLQKLSGIAFDIEELDEEGRTSIGIVLDRVQAAMDVEKVTKRFYDLFKKEHAAFLKYITGITEEADLEWYASVMLNRLMFIYFIQRKGFLDGDKNYLQNRLIRCQEEKGKDKFYSFYRYFLLRLFHEGLGGKTRTPALEKLLGRIPYLNGGLFEPHQIEKSYPKIEIPDKAFERIFNFFGQWDWHLDERPLRSGKEINPDVLGYIFEKYINQKQMGAYYTKEDITGYISQNTVIPYVFDAARPKCKVAFENPDGPTIWDLLKTDPDRYIYPAVQRGVDKKLPPDIAKGEDTSKPKLIERREAWNKAAPVPEYALPTEIWRDVVARRMRYEHIRKKLAAGEVHNINDLITLNLDVRTFALDVIQNCEGPELLRAFWHAIEKVTILDPTCGSGAFLFAALNILEPLYEECLVRMEEFVADFDRSDVKHRSEKMPDFRKILSRVAAHPNRQYFIFKSIILNNLFGVDIMEEAVEICKLRLFLKLAAQVEPDTAHENLGIEPLPDIDFNIKAGNTLVGFATFDEVQKHAEGDFLRKEAIKEIEIEAADLQLGFDKFRERQIEGDGSDPTEDKQELRKRLKKVEDKLNGYLAGEYGVDHAKKTAYSKWLTAYQPFHWFLEFYRILNNGGFDVIIGNPPYLELREVDYAPKNYECQESRAIHAMCMERSMRLLHDHGCMSMIVPLALPSTQRMQVVQNLLEVHGNAWYANFAWRPGKLFDTVNRALTVFVVTPSSTGQTFSTNYQKWTSADREGLFERMHYVSVPRKRSAFWVPKLGDTIEQHILKKLLSSKTTIAHFIGRTDRNIFYRTTGGLYWKVFTDFAPAFRLNGKSGHSSRETMFSVAKREHVKPIIAALSSDVFWWWYTITSNLRDLNPSDILKFPLLESTLEDVALRNLGERYLKDINKNSKMLVREQKQTGTTETQSFKIQISKPILNEIDRVLAKHCGLTEEELDFIINYDIKYRMGREAEDEDE